MILGNRCASFKTPRSSNLTVFFGGLNTKQQGELSILLPETFTYGTLAPPALHRNVARNIGIDYNQPNFGDMVFLD
jgi:hypothetical protein